MRQQTSGWSQRRSGQANSCPASAAVPAPCAAFPVVSLVLFGDGLAPCSVCPGAFAVASVLLFAVQPRVSAVRLAVSADEPVPVALAAVALAAVEPVFAARLAAVAAVAVGFGLAVERAAVHVVPVLGGAQPQAVVPALA